MNPNPTGGVTEGDTVSPGQLAQVWKVPANFVQAEIAAARLVVNSTGHIANSTIGTYLANPTNFAAVNAARNG